MENKGKNSYWRGGRETGYFTDTGYDELNVGTEENSVDVDKDAGNQYQFPAIGD